MKQSLTKLFLFITAVALPVFTHAAVNYITEKAPVVSSSDYTAQYQVTAPASNTVKVYARITEQNTENWNYNVTNGPLTTLQSGSQGQIFSVNFNFANLHLVPNKHYIYYLADGGAAGSNNLTNPACFTTTGKVPCDTATPATPTGAQTLTTNSFTLDALDQTNDPDNAGKYVARFSITPSAGMTTSVPLTFKIFKETASGPVWLKEGNFPGPTVGDVTYPSVDNLDIGIYRGQLYSGATKVSGEAGFQVGGTTPAPVGPMPGDPNIPFVPGATPPVDFSTDPNAGALSYSCGGANGSSTPALTASSANLCSNSTAVEFIYDGFNYSWKCKTSDGTTKSCTATGGTDTNYGDGFLKNPLAPGLDTFPKIFAAVYNNIILPIAIPFIVLAIMYAGFKFVIARKQGSTDGYSEAKRVLKYTLIGTALLLGGWVIANALQGTLDSLLGPNSAQPAATLVSSKSLV